MAKKFLTGIQTNTVQVTGGSPAAGKVLQSDASGNATWQSIGTSSLVTGELPGGSINGVNTVFTTASTYATGSLRVFLNGQRLTAGSGNDYVEGTQSFTMNSTTIPATGDILTIDYNISNGVFIQGSNSSIANETPTGTINGTNPTFTVLLGKYVSNSLEVFVNGLQQIRGIDYTETTPGSGIFTFITIPSTGDIVRVNYQFSTGASGNADTVDGIHASSTPTANQLLPLDATGKLTESTFPVQQAWQSPTLLNSWVNFGSGNPNAQYMKDSLGFVHLQGVVKLGVIGQDIFVLPAGYRPLGQLILPVVSNVAFGIMTIATLGGVNASTGSNAYYTLNGISFKAEQ